MGNIIRNDWRNSGQKKRRKKMGKIRILEFEILLMTTNWGSVNGENTNKVQLHSIW